MELLFLMAVSFCAGAVTVIAYAIFLGTRLSSKTREVTVSMREVRKDNGSSRYYFIDSAGNNYDIALDYVIPRSQMVGYWIIVVDGNDEVIAAMPKLD